MSAVQPARNPCYYKGKCRQTTYALWNGFCRYRCMGDVPKVLQRTSLFPSEKRLKTVWRIHYQGNHDELGDPEFRNLFLSNV